MTAQPPLLSKMVDQFRARHARFPSKIIVDPLALVALGIKKSIAPMWNGIPVECHEGMPKPPKGTPTFLGVHVNVDPKNPKEAFLESYDTD